LFLFNRQHMSDKVAKRYKIIEVDSAPIQSNASASFAARDNASLCVIR